MKRFLEKIQEMRFLPVFVVLSMVIGIAIGKWYGISNFELTPPSMPSNPSFRDLPVQPR